MQIKTLCIPLGPYRNLTTLIASAMASHPQCLVLNHAAERILADPQLDFFAGGNLNTFLEAAIEFAHDRTSRRHGGDIRLSHAFKDETVGLLYEKYKGDRVVLPETRALFWKDSVRITNHVATLGLRPSDIASKFDRIRFVLPIRNPLDCAQGNLRNKFRFLTDSRAPSKLEILERILLVVRSISEDAKKRSGSFVIFTQKELGPEFWSKLCVLLGLDCLENWLADVSRWVRVRPGYTHSNDEIEKYNELVRKFFAKDPGMRDRLLALV